MKQNLVDSVGTLSEITEAIPDNCRGNLTLIGSLAPDRLILVRILGSAG